MRERRVEGAVGRTLTEEDMQHDVYRPYYYDRLAAGLDQTGMPVAWSHRVTGSSILARWLPAGFRNGIDSDAVEGALCPAGTAGGPHHRLVARRRDDPQRLYGRRLHR